ncbi:hypothetical protein, partial [Streptococcus pneumoniae]|uniref:hypothetical protein n=1 Tax=Streptococcus pneumoniae TaxID=1313 RepID=UPI00396C3DFE
MNPRSPDFTDCFSPVFGNSCLELVIVSCGRELVDPLALVDADVLADVLALVDADVLADVLALVDADVLADVLALVDA